MKVSFTRIVSRIEKASFGWNNAVIAIASSAIVVMLLLVVADVSARYSMNSPIRGAVEIEQILLAYVCFVGLAYALIKGTHVRVTLLISRLSPRWQMAAEILADLAGIAFFAFVTWGGIGQFWDSWVIQEIMPASVELPYWITKLAMPLGTALIAVQFLIALLRDLGSLFSKKGED